MKVAYLIPKFPTLSETFISREVQALKGYGIDVSLYSFIRPSDSEISQGSFDFQDLVRQTDYIGFSDLFKRVPRGVSEIVKGWNESNSLPQSRSSTVRRYLRLARAVTVATRLSDSSADHLHAHWPYASQVAYLVSKISGIPYSASIHAHEILGDNNHFQRMFETIEFAAFCNRTGRDLVASDLPDAYESKCRLRYHGVDLDRFRYNPDRRLASELHIFSAGRFTRDKGFDRLIEACAKLRENGTPARLTILGDGTMMSRCRELVENFGISSYVDLPGWIPHDRLPEYLENCDVMAIPAERDWLPNVVFESMAMGLPVIASPLHAIDEVVSNGVEGYLLKSHMDVDGLVDALGSLWDDRSKLMEMGALARRKIEQNFNSEDQVRKLVGWLQGSTEAVTA